MKKIDNKAFWIIICGIGAMLIMQIVSLVQIKNIDMSEALAALNPTQDMINAVNNLVFGLTIVIFVFVFLFYTYFIYRLLKNRKVATKQGYITFLFVINIIGVILNAISLLGGDFLVLISIAINIAIIAGCHIQRKYNPPAETDQQMF